MTDSTITEATPAGTTAKGAGRAGWLRLLRAELRKLTSTKLPWGFMIALVVIAAINATAVIFGTDMDGSKAFISTADDQRSLMAFAGNALMGATLFGAMAVAREYGYGTVVPTFLASPRRHRAVLAQLTAVAVVGGVLGLIGAALTITAVALSLGTTEYGFLVSAGVVLRLLAAAAYCGAAGAVLGAGIGSVVSQHRWSGRRRRVRVDHRSTSDRADGERHRVVDAAGARQRALRRDLRCVRARGVGRDRTLGADPCRHRTRRRPTARHRVSCHCHGVRRSGHRPG
jgi:hypothetical protein